MSKKPLAIILAFFIVFAPVYANAVLLPLLAVAASSTGRVLVGNAIKRVGQAAISRAGMASMAAGLAYMGSTKSAIEQDGWTISGGGAGGSWEDENGNIDIEIYKPVESDENVCTYDFTTSFSPTISSTRYPSYESLKAGIRGLYPSSSYNFLEFDGTCDSNYSSAINRIDIDPLPSPLPRSVSTGNCAITLKAIKSPYNEVDTAFGYSINATICSDTQSTKNYMSESQFNTYITQNITNNNAGDVIKNIYNYDYSQHPNITINNNSYGGNSINNDLSVSADPELRVSPRLKLDIESNKVNLDNVNDTNCTKNEAGEYDNCTGEPDPEDEEETDPDDPTNPSPEEPPPIECDANGFYKKICDWMDWTKQPHTEPTSTNVVVTDKSSEIVIDDSRINFDDQCPAPKDIDITVAGHSFSDALDYQPLCDFFTKLHPFVVGMGGISSALIIAGGVRRG